MGTAVGLQSQDLSLGPRGCARWALRYHVALPDPVASSLLLGSPFSSLQSFDMRLFLRFRLLAVLILESRDQDPCLGSEPPHLKMG